MHEAIETLGVWEDLTDAPALSRQRMELEAAQLAQHWRRCSLSADFWARYTTMFVPDPPAPGRLNRAAVEHVLSYLLNELFENCAKFSGGSVGRVAYDCLVREGELIFAITNHILPERRAAFAGFVGELLDGDPEELYFKRLEESAESNATGSGLGYLTLMKDYGIRFGFQFVPAAADSVAVTVQAHVNLQEHP